MINLEAAIQRYSLKKPIHLMYIWGIPVVGLISSKAAGSMSAILVGVGSFVGVSQVFFLFYYLLCERRFLGNCLQRLFHNFQYTFHFNLRGRKVLWRAPIADGFLINIWYCVSCLLNINSALTIQRAFLHRGLIY